MPNPGRTSHGPKNKYNERIPLVSGRVNCPFLGAPSRLLGHGFGSTVPRDYEGQWVATMGSHLGEADFLNSTIGMSNHKDAVIFSNSISSHTRGYGSVQNEDLLAALRCQCGPGINWRERREVPRKGLEPLLLCWYNKATNQHLLS